MGKKISFWIFRLVRGLVEFFYPNTKVAGLENLPKEPCIIVGNHTQMNGPIIGEIHFPGERYTWCAGQMMKLKDVPAYAYQDFWSQKPKSSRWFYKLLSYIIAPLAACIFSNARTIPVYHDARLVTTFRITLQKLREGANIIIFPEHDVKYNHILYEFQDKFIDVAKLYYKRTGQELCFVPMYVAPKLKTAYLGQPIRFCADAPIKEERERICCYLMDEITEIACNLPRHTVVPYRNIPKKQYPKNIPEETRP